MSAAAIDLDQLRTWIGRAETRTDFASAVPYAALSLTLDRDDAEPENGTVVPPLWHWLYFLPMSPMNDVGPDGHPQRGGFCRRCRCRGACLRAGDSNSIIH